MEKNRGQTAGSAEDESEFIAGLVAQITGAAANETPGPGHAEKKQHPGCRDDGGAHYAPISQGIEKVIMGPIRLQLDREWAVFAESIIKMRGPCAKPRMVLPD